jgi:chaperonin GroEL
MSKEQQNTTTIIDGITAKKQLLEGASRAAQAILCTMGPKGKTVLIQNEDKAPIITKDGVTVSKAIKFKDQIQQMGAALIKEAASHTNDVAGDGTTTATALTYAIMANGLKLLEANHDSKSICEGIEKCSQIVDQHLMKIAKPITTREEISQIGTISANGDKDIGNLIADAIIKVGNDGVVTVEDAKGTTTALQFVEGMQIENRGFLSPYFVTHNDKMIVAYDNCKVLITDKKISTMSELIPILEKIAKSRQPLLIIADDVEGEALHGLVLNRVNGSLPVTAIKAPGYGQHRIELLKDICVLTNAKLISATTGLSIDKCDLSDLGIVKRIICDAKSTTLVGAGDTKNAIEEHLNNLRLQSQDVTITQDELQKLKIRIAKLSSGVAIIKVGGSTEVEMIEKKYRIEDSLNAVRAAISEGIIPGGGVTLARIAFNLQKLCIFDDLSSDVKEGTQIVLKAIITPLKRIIENSEIASDVIIHELQKKSNEIGYNAANGTFVDMIETGIIDPVKVTRSALKNATSVAITFLTLGAVIIND